MLKLYFYIELNAVNERISKILSKVVGVSKRFLFYLFNEQTRGHKNIGKDLDKCMMEEGELEEEPVEAIKQNIITKLRLKN